MKKSILVNAEKAFLNADLRQSNADTRRLFRRENLPFASLRIPRRVPRAVEGRPFACNLRESALKDIFSMVTILVFIISIVFFWVSEGIAFDYSKARDKMIKEQIISRGVKDAKVISAMEDVKRHLFVPSRLTERAYDDGPLPIGYSQTISQPYIVAFMSEALNLEPDDIVLEIGTGSGYQAAILAEIVKKVYTIEILEPLAGQSRDRLKDLGYEGGQRSMIG